MSLCRFAQLTNLTFQAPIAPLYRLLSMHFCKCRGYNHWKHYCSFCIDLDALSTYLNLSPADSLVRSGAGIAAIKLLCCVNVHGTLRTTAHSASIRNVMLNHAASKYYDACSFCPHRNRVDLADILYDVDA